LGTLWRVQCQGAVKRDYRRLKESWRQPRWILDSWPTRSKTSWSLRSPRAHSSHLEEADAIYREQGLDAYREYQRAREDEALAPGTAFPLVRGLLHVNSLTGKTLVEVIVVSRNDADSGLRILKSAEALGLDITRAAFTDGADPWPYLKPLACNLFLSTEPDAVQEAVDIGFPAARVLDPPVAITAEEVGPLKIAFDGDAVLLDGETLWNVASSQRYGRRGRRSAVRGTLAPPRPALCRS
jgi:5'-nucleotidase